MFILVYISFIFLLIITTIKVSHQQINDDTIEILYKKYSSILIVTTYYLVTSKVSHIPLLFILFIPLPQRKFFSGHVYKTIIVTHFLVEGYKSTTSWIWKLVEIILIALVNLYLIKTIKNFHSKRELLVGWVLGVFVVFFIIFLMNKLKL